MILIFSEYFIHSETRFNDDDDYNHDNCHNNNNDDDHHDDNCHTDNYDDHHHQAAAHCEKLFRVIDIDGDGNLTEKEFLRVNYHQNYHYHYTEGKLSSKLSWS